ncbi:hypothetical protein [Maricaulis sp.]|uniref:tetratricopeptide repeat protein n=1 Tax=Maricaulis sp. TaxID=1486257 RepID=UPI000C4F3629|nr:hypothetical protein [Maricaulis sp.]MAC89534.1 hypothetical protein [Maricaulis sp.]
MLRVCLLAGIMALTGATASAQTPPPSLREQAEAGDPVAAFEFGYSLTFPEDGEPDTVTGRYWLVQAANAGHQPANHMLGVVYRDGFGVGADIDRARAFFELAWQAGDTVAGHDLAELMLYDYGDERDVAVEILEAILGDVDAGPAASLTLAETLMFDGDGEADAVRAVTLARDALDRDGELYRAHYLLGIGAAEGLSGPVDQAAARLAWEAGSAAGDTLALIALADSWLDPDWGVNDRGEAMALYALAGELGDDQAAAMAAELVDDLDEAETERADLRRRAWENRMGWEPLPE